MTAMKAMVSRPWKVLGSSRRTLRGRRSRRGMRSPRSLRLPAPSALGEGVADTSNRQHEGR